MSRNVSVLRTQTRRQTLRNGKTDVVDPFICNACFRSHLCTQSFAVQVGIKFAKMLHIQFAICALRVAQGDAHIYGASVCSTFFFTIAQIKSSKEEKKTRLHIEMHL
jgi:hypothetical protein